MRPIQIVWYYRVYVSQPAQSFIVTHWCPLSFRIFRQLDSESTNKQINNEENEEILKIMLLKWTRAQTRTHMNG